MASTTPQICDFCGKEADPEGEDCWVAVCVANHPEDLYHERCMQKYMRSMPGKNCDMSRRSGMPCLRGIGKGTQYKTICPGKVTHCQKVVVKSKSKAAPAPAAPPQAPAPKAPKPAPKPKPLPKAAASSSSSNKPHKAPENTWVPPKPIHLDAQAPRADPLGRNTAAAAAAASKAAKKNAKRAAGKKRTADTASGPTDGSLSDTSSMAEVSSRAGGGGGGAAAALSGLSGHYGAEHAEADLWDGDDEEGVELDEEQLLLLELLRQQRGKQPHELLFHTPDHTSVAGDGSSSDGSDGDEEEQQAEASAGLHHAHVSGLQQQLAAASLSAPNSAPHAPQPHALHQQQQHQPQFSPQQQQLQSSHISPLAAAAVGPVASAPVAVTAPGGLAGYFQQPVVATPPAPLQQWHNGMGGAPAVPAAAVSPAAAAVEVVESDDKDDYETEELMALLMGS